MSRKAFGDRRYGKGQPSATKVQQPALSFPDQPTDRPTSAALLGCDVVDAEQRLSHLLALSQVWVEQGRFCVPAHLRAYASFRAPGPTDEASIRLEAYLASTSRAALEQVQCGRVWQVLAQQSGLHIVSCQVVRRAPVQGAGGLTQGAVPFLLGVMVPKAGPVEVDVWLIDAAGNDSNILSVTLQAE